MKRNVFPLYRLPGSCIQKKGQLLVSPLEPIQLIEHLEPTVELQVTY